MDIPLAQNRRLMGIVFEFEEIPGWIFEEKSVMLDARPGKPHARLLIEGQLFRLSLPQELFP